MIDLTRVPRFTRRRALALPVAALAVAAVPPSSAAPIVPATAERDAEWRRLSDRLRVGLTPEQWALHNELVNLAIHDMVDENARVVEALCRHFAGVGGAIRSAVAHVIRDGDRDMHGCCRDAG
jgi:hypothetical protein